MARRLVAGGIFDRNLFLPTIISLPIIGQEIIVQNNGALINDAVFILSNLAGQKIKELNYATIFFW
jgi:hypothetical protein